MEYEGSYSCIRESLIYFSYIRLIAWWCTFIFAHNTQRSQHNTRARQLQHFTVLALLMPASRHTASLRGPPRHFCARAHLPERCTVSLSLSHMRVPPHYTGGCRSPQREAPCLSRKLERSFSCSSAPSHCSHGWHRAAMNACRPPAARKRFCRNVCPSRHDVCRP